jgi:hypothetical protein
VPQVQEYLVQLVLAEILVPLVPLELGLQEPQVQELLVLRVQLAPVLLVPLGQLVQAYLVPQVPQVPQVQEYLAQRVQQELVLREPQALTELLVLKVQLAQQGPELREPQVPLGLVQVEQLEQPELRV